MKQKGKIYKKIIFAVVALALIVGIVAADLYTNVETALAKQNVFHAISKYQQDGLKVLEITPTADDKDFGYYFEASTQDQLPNVTDLTHGNVLLKKMDGAENLGQIQTLKEQAVQEARANYATELAAWLATNQYQTEESFFEWGMSWETKQEYEALINTKFNELLAAAGIDPSMANVDMDLLHILTLRRYGMTKPIGEDAVININNRNQALSEYPIYISNGFALFINATLTGGQYTPITVPSGSIEQGYYRLCKDADGNLVNTGAYNINLDQYAIGDGSEATDAVDKDGNPISLILEDKVIYKKTVYVEDQGSNQTETVSANTLSGNSIPSDKADTKYIYEVHSAQQTNGLPVDVTYVTSGGNLEFVYKKNVSGKYYGYSTEELLIYSNNRKYRLGNWIKEYILGDATKDYKVSYQHATMAEMNAGTYDISKYDLIYISGTAEEYQAAGDMNETLVKQLYDASAINHKAVMMDYALYDGEEAYAGDTNIDKLALLLWQEDQTVIAESDEADYKDFKDYFAYDDEGKVKEISDITGLLGDTDLMDMLKEEGNLLSGHNGNFAVNNVYVYNHHWSDFQNSKLEPFQNNALDIFANGDLNSAYTSTAVAGGFQSVIAYIAYNNNNPVDDGNGEMTDGYVTPAIAIQYILSYKGEDLALVKNAFSVLEIEPTKEFRFNSTMETVDFSLETAEVKANRNAFIKRCLDADIVDNNAQDYVTFTSVTIDQFNTMQTDLVHDYDVIYIGDEFKKYYNLRKDVASNKVENGQFVATTVDLPIFNDVAMTGNVYFNYGDMVLGGTNTDMYYASRDLTEAKLNELKEYLQYRGLIITDEDLMVSLTKGNPTINPTKSTAATSFFDHGRMDTSSNMYELFNFALGKTFDGTQSMGNRYQSGALDENGDVTGRFANFVSYGDIGTFVEKDDILIYLNRERVSLNMTEEPVQYMYNTGMTPTYIAAEDDLNYYLECEFIIENSAVVVDAESVYQVHFYQDMNADGRFSDTEEKTDFEISQVANDQVVAPIKGDDGVTQYNLSCATAYRLRREIPSDEGGIINWCIKVEKIANKDINCTASGFTAVKPREVKYLNVLQIIPDGDNATINLEDELAKGTSELSELLTDPVVAENYEITVRTVTVSQFQADTMAAYTRLLPTEQTNEKVWNKYFSTFQRTDSSIYSTEQIENDAEKPMNINMVILGFGNNYTQFTNTHPVFALRAFMDSNKPVLTSNNAVDWGVVQKQVTAADGTVTTVNYNAFYKMNEVVVNDVKMAQRSWLYPTYSFLSYFGQDRYGVTNPLYASLVSTKEVATLADRTQEPELSKYLAPRENSRLAVAHSHNSERGSVFIIPMGYTNTFAARQRVTGEEYGFIHNAAVEGLTSTKDPTANMTGTYVDKVNDGQVSYYPYTIGNLKTALLSKSQAQKFQLDLDKDSDRDGNSDIIVWYTLGDMVGANNVIDSTASIYSATPGDGINNYYIYNYGNVTFTGFGANKEADCTTDEKKLFVNTLIAAYEAGLVNPTVSYYETEDSNSKMLTSIAVPYDYNVTGRNDVDSSIQFNEDGDDYLYKFVNPNTDTSTAVDGTKAYFKVQDSNNVRGEKKCQVYFYLAVDRNIENGYYTWPNTTQRSRVIQLQLNDNSIVDVVEIPITIYDPLDFTKVVGTSNPSDLSNNPYLEVGQMYGFYVPMSYLEDRGAAEIYIKADTSYKILNDQLQEVDAPLGTAYDMFTIIKQDLLKLD